MKKITALVVSIAAASTLSASEYKYSITPMFGGVEPLTKEYLDSATSLGARLGYNIDTKHTIELGYDFMDSIDYLSSAIETDSHQISANYLYHFKDAGDRVRPYLLAGLGVQDFTSNSAGLKDGGIGNLGLGLKILLTEAIALRLEARDFIRFQDGGHTLAYTAGLAIPFGKVENGAPALTQEPAKEVAKELDSDGDGVIDSADKCPSTPKGVEVDLDGCAVDSDRDGVADYKDECKATSEGVKVDEKGCPIDSDNDGVADFMDKCPNSKTAEVDEKGCALDSDKDGVADYLDKCLNTPEGFKVDTQGCAVGFTMNVNFATNSAKIESNETPYIDKLAAFMKEHPSTKVRLEGYTDSDGSAAYNLKLSKKRAEAVKRELIARGIDGSRITTKAFGEENPIASNDTPEGKAKNRRVEAVIIPTQR